MSGLWIPAGLLAVASVSGYLRVSASSVTSLIRPGAGWSGGCRILLRAVRPVLGTVPLGGATGISTLLLSVTVPVVRLPSMMWSRCPAYLLSRQPDLRIALGRTPESSSGRGCCPRRRHRLHTRRKSQLTHVRIECIGIGFYTGTALPGLRHPGVLFQAGSCAWTAWLLQRLCPAA